MSTTTNPEVSEKTTAPMCDGCGEEPAVCMSKAGRSAGTDPDADIHLCNSCCSHSGEEGPCFRISDGVAMADLSDEEIGIRVE